MLEPTGVVYMGLCVQAESGVVHPTRVVGGTKVLGYILGFHVAKFVTGDALGVQRAHQAAVYNVELGCVVLPGDVESMCSRKGISPLSDPARVVGVVGQMVLDIGDALAEAILAKVARVVDVESADDAGGGRGPGAVHGQDERVHVCVGGTSLHTCSLDWSLSPPPSPYCFKTSMA